MAVSADTMRLKWVRGEVGALIDLARAALETHTAGESDQAALENATECLSRTRGTLELLELYGAAMLAQETQLLFRQITADPNTVEPDTVDAAALGLVRLGDYLDRVAAGARDLPVVVLPWLNDLRAARRAPLLSEASCFNFPLDAPVQRTPGTGDAHELARILRHRYQRGLLGILRGERIGNALETLGAVVEELQNACTSDAAWRFFQAAAALVESLWASKESGFAVKRLLARIDEAIRDLGEQGEEALAIERRAELIRNLLYYVGTSRSDSPRVAAVIETYGLDTAFPAADEIDATRAAIAAPGQDVMAAFTHAVSEELALVHDRLDLFTRSPARKATDLAELVRPLQSACDALSLGGRGELAARLGDEAARLGAIARGEQAIDDVTLTGIAESLIYVESALASLNGSADASGDGASTAIHDAALGELLRELAAICETAEACFAGEDRHEILSRRLLAARGVYRILGLDDGARLAGVLAERCASDFEKQNTQQRESFAGALSALMEWTARPAGERWMAAGLIGHAASLLGFDAEPACSVPDTREVRPETPPKAPLLAAQPVIAPPADDIDPEIFEVFLEEAAEVREALDTHYPAWRDSGDHAPLVETRRAFHTLKGSGRMVRAHTVSELAWAVENLLNRVLDETVPASAPVIGWVGEVVAALPELIGALSGGRTSTIDGEPLRLRGHALAEGCEVEARAPAESCGEDTRTDIEEQSTAVGPEEPSGDELLRAVFAQEAASHIATLRAFIARTTGAAHASVPATVHTAFHTLRGGALSSDMHDIARLAAAMESLLASVRDQGGVCDDTLVSLIARATDAVATLCEGGIQADIDELCAAIEHTRAACAARPAPTPAGAPVTTGILPDAEVTQIFVEEANELLEKLQTSLTAWENAPEHSLHVSAINRSLHTLKGSARLAGITPLADIAHALESLLGAVLTGTLSVSRSTFTMAQRSADRMASMVETVAGGHFPSPAIELLAALERTTHGDTPEATVPAAPAAVADPRIDTPAMEQAPEDTQSAETALEPALARNLGDSASRRQHEQLRITAHQLDQFVNLAGELGLYRSRTEQQNHRLDATLGELGATVARLKDQLRKLDIETEAQILYRFQQEGDDANREFDPLEMDRFSTIQQLSRALSETVSDLTDIDTALGELARETDTLLVQQGRVGTELSEGLLRTRMVPFARIVPRLERIVRQTAEQLGKQARLTVDGAQGELDRSVLDRLIGPMEHLLRNSLAHGIEKPAVRTEWNKPPQGAIRIEVRREGTEVVLAVSDDGAGIDVAAVRERAAKLGLIPAGARLANEEIYPFILESGFSTAKNVDQVSGRGVGMDVVNREVRQMGGTLTIGSTPGKGATFTVRLPFTLAIQQTMLVQSGDDIYALLTSGIEGVVRIPRAELESRYAAAQPDYFYAGQRHELIPLSALLGHEAAAPDPSRKWYPLILLKSGDRRVALAADHLLGSRETVVKNVGPQLGRVRWIAGGTILGDGRVVLIVDAGVLVRQAAARKAETPVTAAVVATPEVETTPLVMVVDDSITVRKITQRLLERHGYRVLTAKDGLDAFEQLGEHLPDLLLLDIEMPRMDGYELAQHVRASERLKHIPMMMITSRTGAKHRARALEIGVDRYLGKPYQEQELLDEARELVAGLRRACA